MTQTLDTYYGWKSDASGCTACLYHEGVLILRETLRSPRRAVERAYDMVHAGKAGLIQPVPLAKLAQMRAEAPLRAPVAQAAHLDALPLFGDSASQIDLMDLLRG